MDIHYYIIHNLDPKRRDNMVALCQQYGIDEKDITWMLHPNKDELTPEFMSEYVPVECVLRLGYVSCTYKHYLSLQDIVKNGHKLAVIMEDNIGKFDENVHTRIGKYLEQLPDDWDILFDGGRWLKYTESEISEDKIVYLKSNIGNSHCGGGTRCAQFYMLNLECAKKLLKHYLPIDRAPDWKMNGIFPLENIKSYWAVPSNVHTEENHVSSG